MNKMPGARQCSMASVQSANAHSNVDINLDFNDYDDGIWGDEDPFGDFTQKDYADIDFSATQVLAQNAKSADQSNSFAVPRSIDKPAKGILWTNNLDEQQWKSLELNRPGGNDVKSLQDNVLELKTEKQSLHQQLNSKDGEIKVLRDSLHRSKVELSKQKSDNLVRIERQLQERSDKEKQLEKDLEKFKTQLQFKEREVIEMHTKIKSLRLNQDKPTPKPIQKTWQSPKVSGASTQSPAFPSVGSFQGDSTPIKSRASAKVTCDREIQTHQTGSQGSQRKSRKFSCAKDVNCKPPLLVELMRRTHAGLFGEGLTSMLHVGHSQNQDSPCDHVTTKAKRVEEHLRDEATAAVNTLLANDPVSTEIPQASTISKSSHDPALLLLPFIKHQVNALNKICKLATSALVSPKVRKATRVHRSLLESGGFDGGRQTTELIALNSVVILGRLIMRREQVRWSLLEELRDSEPQHMEVGEAERPSPPCIGLSRKRKLSSRKELAVDVVTEEEAPCSIIGELYEVLLFYWNHSTKINKDIPLAVLDILLELAQNTPPSSLLDNFSSSVVSNGLLKTLLHGYPDEAIFHKMLSFLIHLCRSRTVLERMCDKSENCLMMDILNYHSKLPNTVSVQARLEISLQLLPSLVDLLYDAQLVMDDKNKRAVASVLLEGLVLLEVINGRNHSFVKEAVDEAKYTVLVYHMNRLASSNVGADVEELAGEAPPGCLAVLEARELWPYVYEPWSDKSVEKCGKNE